MANGKKGKKPNFNIRAKVGDYWMTCGAAWVLDDGNISIRMNAVPVGDWDGSFLAMPPLEDKEEADKDGKE